MAALDPVDRIEVSGDDAGLFLVAGSFEPRSVRATGLLDGNVDRAVVFNYDDTLDTETGRRNTRQIEARLHRHSQSVDVLRCQVADPFSVVRAFHTYVTRERLVGAVRSVVLDATCFTKLHLLLLPWSTVRRGVHGLVNVVTTVSHQITDEESGRQSSPIGNVILTPRPQYCL